jgi:hypothetical protein
MLGLNNSADYGSKKCATEIGLMQTLMGVNPRPSPNTAGGCLEIERKARNTVAEAFADMIRVSWLLARRALNRFYFQYCPCG